ncbi:MAG: DUF1837 domain-containing protein [Bacteroidales bacterium]|nr:DUF1837 domain-containing protein [Bacteroidales bacterium]
MSGKIWNFNILIDDSFVNFNPNSVEITPDTNDFLVSLVNGFEEGHWMKKNFQNFIYNNIVETALKAEERIKIVDDSYSCLVESAKHLRLIDKDGVDEETKKKDKGRGSEIAEIVLYGIMKHHFNAIPAIPKIYYKQNDKMNALGDDSVHIVITKDGDFQIWLGEAKFYNDLDDKRFGEPLDSIAQMLNPAIIRKEIGILTGLNELDVVLRDNLEMLENVKSILKNFTSIDEIKERLHVPILLLHECEITNCATRLSEEYKKKIIDYHYDRATTYFKKQINKFKSYIDYDKINFHLILFPVPNKSEIVEWFISRAKTLREDAQ